MSDRRLVAVLLAALTLLAACTGVPTQSTPQTVESIGLGQRPFVAGGPKAGSPPQQIVQDFLTSNVSDPVKHAVAREFLTAAARNRWTDTTVTVIAQERVGLYDAKHHTVTVTGRKVGTVAANGVYTPTLDGTGSGGATVPFAFGIDAVRGEYRISSLTPGLLLTTQQFADYFSQRTLYYFDNAGRYLVPDPRYSPLTDADDIADWMLEQLLQPPSQAVSAFVNTDPIAAQPQRVTVDITAAATTVQIPGARQLGGDVLNRLAAQISITLGRAVNVNNIVLMDGTRPVVIPQTHTAEVSPVAFESALGPDRPERAVYFLRNGRIREEDGKALPGPLGNGTTLFDSVALTRPSTLGVLLVAGVQGPPGSSQQLLVGTQDGGVHATKVPAGRLTRPAWFPGRTEVWVGDGAKLYRVTTADGRTSQVSQVQLPSIAGGGRILAVRPSPDGSRVALAVQGVNDQAQLYVGGIVRAGNTVQIVSPTPISPSGAVVDDVAWIDPVKLYAIGYLAAGKDSEVYRTNVDGFGWDNLGIGTLVDPPDSITVGYSREAAAPWVSAQGYVWELNGGPTSETWVSPVAANGQTPGDNPIYLG